MVSFTTVVAAIAASAALTSAQGGVTYDAFTGKFTCAIPNGAYCASSSLSSNIIIRCNNGVGQPGNCNDNLAGEPPAGVNYAPCWQTSDTSGDAACSKNCIVYGNSGKANGTFTLPGCTPTATASSTASYGAAGTIRAVPTGYISTPSNSTKSSGVAGAAGSTGTATPVGPSSSSTSGFSQLSYGNGAVANSAGSLAAVGLIAAIFL